MSLSCGAQINKSYADKIATAIDPSYCTTPDGKPGTARRTGYTITTSTSTTHSSTSSNSNGSSNSNSVSASASEVSSLIESFSTSRISSFGFILS